MKPLQDDYISLAHGNGGRYMRELIDGIFARHLDNPGLDTHADAAQLQLDSRQVMFTTDGFTVKPIEFPGGNIGSLAIHGTVNDLAVSGAVPRWLAVNAFIEEGLEVATLDRIVAAMGMAAREAGVSVVAGDTKVVERGEGGGLYLATTGIGIRRPGLDLGIDRIRTGDRLLVSGPVGDHGICVMLAREQFGLRGDLSSDSASVLPLTDVAASLPGLRFMRDPTRGGIATVCNDIASATGLQVRLQAARLPVRDPVLSVCDMLGYDPYYLACEGRVVAVTDEASAPVLLQAWQQLPGGEQSAIIGQVTEGRSQVVLETDLGGERLLEELEDDPLPRIC